MDCYILCNLLIDCDVFTYRFWTFINYTDCDFFLDCFYLPMKGRAGLGATVASPRRLLGNLLRGGFWSTGLVDEFPLRVRSPRGQTGRKGFLWGVEA